MKTQNHETLTLRAGNWYVYQDPENPKKFRAIKALVPNASKLSGFLESERKGQNVEKVTIPVKNIVLDLGPNPLPGKVYGIDLVNRYRKTLIHPFWGNVCVYTEIDKAQLKLVHSSLERTAKKIERMGVESYVDLCDTHLIAKQGKWAGRYKHNGNHNKDIPHVIQYAPECADMEPKAMDYLVYHEFGHLLRYNGVLGKKLRGKWTEEFIRSIASFEITEGNLRKLFRFMEENVDTDATLSQVFREFVSDDEDHKLWVRGLLRWFKEVHHLNPKDLSVLWATQDLSHFKKLWPNKAVDSSKLAPVVSEYATTNVEELFAESFSFYCTGRKLPNRIVELVERSISYAKAATEKN